MSFETVCRFLYLCLDNNDTQPIVNDLTKDQNTNLLLANHYSQMKEDEEKAKESISNTINEIGNKCKILIEKIIKEATKLALDQIFIFTDDEGKKEKLRLMFNQELPVKLRVQEIEKEIKSLHKEEDKKREDAIKFIYSKFNLFNIARAAFYIKEHSQANEPSTDFYFQSATEFVQKSSAFLSSINIQIENDSSSNPILDIMDKNIKALKSYIEDDLPKTKPKIEVKVQQSKKEDKKEDDPQSIEEDEKDDDQQSNEEDEKDDDQQSNEEEKIEKNPRIIKKRQLKKVKGKKQKPKVQKPTEKISQDESQQSDDGDDKDEGLTTKSGENPINDDNTEKNPTNDGDDTEDSSTSEVEIKSPKKKKFRKKSGGKPKKK